MNQPKARTSHVLIAVDHADAREYLATHPELGGCIVFTPQSNWGRIDGVSIDSFTLTNLLGVALYTPGKARAAVVAVRYVSKLVEITFCKSRHS